MSPNSLFEFLFFVYIADATKRTEALVLSYKSHITKTLGLDFMQIKQLNRITADFKETHVSILYVILMYSNNPLPLTPWCGCFIAERGCFSFPFSSFKTKTDHMESRPWFCCFPFSFCLFLQISLTLSQNVACVCVADCYKMLNSLIDCCLSSWNYCVFTWASVNSSNFTTEC